MKFKQKYKGVSRIPSGKGFSISLSEADIKSEKSASPEPPKEISYEGQGGKDYENRPEDAINPEGQGGKDYSDYEDSMSRKASPFNHRDKTGKPIQGPKKHSHSTPIDTSNLSYFTDQAKINNKNTDAKKKAKDASKKALIERINKGKK